MEENVDEAKRIAVFRVNSFDMRCTSPEFSRSPPLTLRLAPNSEGGSRRSLSLYYLILFAQKGNDLPFVFQNGEKKVSSNNLMEPYLFTNIDNID